jgi:hypothetical protein
MKSNAIGASSMLALCIGLSLPITTSASSLLDCVNAWNATLDCVANGGIAISEVACSRTKGANAIAVVAGLPDSGELQAWSTKKNPKEKKDAICHVSSSISGCEHSPVQAVLPSNGYRLWNRLIKNECGLIEPTP